MNKLLTEDYNFIKRFNPLAAEVFKDRKYYYMSDKEIIKYRKITCLDLKTFTDTYNELLRNKNEAWLFGLSGRAKAALIKNRYKEFKSVYADVMNEKVDLESFTGVGHKVALEIRKWCLHHS